MDNPCIVSPTLADIYLRQGYIETAIDIYNKLVKQEPHNDVFKKKLASLKKELKSKNKASGFRKALQKKIW